MLNRIIQTKHTAPLQKRAITAGVQITF